MFVGHYAVAFAAKKPAPTVSLGTLFIAAQFLDLLWPLLLLSGMESVGLVSSDSPFLRLELHDYPISHSLLTVVGWSLLFGVAYFLLKRSARGAWILGLAVFSHWVLDFITHRPDIPLYPGSTTYVGLGLWNSFAGTTIVEGVLFLAAALVYARATTAKDATGQYAFWALAAFKQHCAFGFWKASLMSDAAKFATVGNTAMGHLGQITSLADLPPDTTLIGYIKEAAQLNRDGVKVPKNPAAKKTLIVPSDLAAALKKNKKARETFEAFSPSNKRDYVEWLTEAKAEATRAKRLATAMEWMAEGKIRNWKYVRGARP